MGRALTRPERNRDSGEEWRARIDPCGLSQHACLMSAVAPENRIEAMLDKTKSGGMESGQLRAFIERIERLEEEKRTIADDIKDVYAEAKGNGFDVKIMRKVVSLRRQDVNKRREEEEILDLYLSALGMHAAA